MIKEIKIRTIKNNYNYISECEVLDTDTNDTFYVVTQLGNLFYNTYKSSYIDYVKGITKEKPIKVEGNDYMWANFDCDCGETKFWEQYGKTLEEASKLEHRYYINHKYPHLKKPLGNIKYKILNKKSNSVFGCGPIGDAYEIEFLILDDNSKLYVYSDDAIGAFSLTDYSVVDATLAEQEGREAVYGRDIEQLSNFKEAKYSKYYDLYLEMEKLKDNYYD